MQTLSIPAASAPRSGWLRRLLAAWRAPSLRELDAATLADIGAAPALREQAALRDAYRHWMPVDPWRSL